MSSVPSDRLWPTLGAAPRRDPPPTGVDAVGAWLHGRLNRRSFLIDRRERAVRIAEASDDLRDCAEADLDAHAAAVIDAVRLRPSSPEAIDDAYALLREVIRRELGIALHVEQVMGALVMADGAAAEMATGEGKTVTAILPAALLGWRGRGVHVLTVNDYLAGRDAEIVRGPLARVGLGVASIDNDTPKRERRAAYDADVTYASDKQLVFDYLRDRLLTPLTARPSSCLLEEVAPDREHTAPGWLGRVVQRGLHAAIVDEADSVLIDEAVTPAIITADQTDDGSASDDPGRQYRVAASLASGMREREHYTLDRRTRHIELTDAGRAAAEGRRSELPGFWAGDRRREELVRTALIAKELMLRDDDYIVREGAVEIVDRSTGRVLEGRKWQLGLQQAVEAKEGLETSEARRTSSRISYARFFQQYRYLSGMSGTLSEVRDELWRTYRLAVVPVPTHRPIARRENADRAFATIEAKHRAVVDRAETLHATGQPLLIGTRSVTASESIAAELAQRGIACRVLNAEREREEAEIVAEAGRLGAVTVATNMAGRGTDIKLEDGARAAGGLCVLGTERHAERRVDRQLFGRSGRQGDPGSAEMFVSLEDDVIRAHGMPWLVWLARRIASFRPVLWKQAQLSGSSRARSSRTAAGMHENWLETSMHGRSR
ncbi:MAG: hypothetical protein AAGB48_00030 [Planctomycetota bacterium]